MIRVAICALVLAGCQARSVDLGFDATVDAPAPDAPTCRCRISLCRTASDCGLTGGVCGSDLYCAGDLGACSTDTQCEAISAGAVCTKGTTSTTPCE